MEKSLRPAVFCAIAEIQPGVHCYHVYGKVMSVKEVQRKKVGGDGGTQIEGVIADKSGCARFRFPAEQAGAVKENAIIAIRNGKSTVVDEHILLEVDRYGRITAESVDVGTPNTERNISDIAWERRPGD